MGYNVFNCVFLPSLVFLWVVVVVYGDIRINCGSFHNLSVGNRVFLDDVHTSNYLITPVSILGNSSGSKNLGLYQTARIFTGVTRYKFSIRQSGRYVIRLYFYPFSYRDYDLSTSHFLVSTNDVNLLNVVSPRKSMFLKEYSLGLTPHMGLRITLAPKLNSVAFLNALEAFLIPNRIIKDHNVLDVSTHLRLIFNLSDVPLETFYRVNMGGSVIHDDLWRTWTSDDKFLENKELTDCVQNISKVHYAEGGFEKGIATRDDAPSSIYGTCRRLSARNTLVAKFNVTWTFDIDPGFSYFIRFHYCDIVSAFLGGLDFNVYINSWEASSTLNQTFMSGKKLGTPIFQDFVTPVLFDTKIRIKIGLKENRDQADGILNGLEIMKVGDMDTLGLAANPLPMTSSSHNKKSMNDDVGIIVRAIFGVLCLLGFLIILFLLYGRQDDTNTTLPPVFLDVGTSCIPLEAIEKATHNFDENFVIGSGGFGKVYRAELNGQEVAVKRGNEKNDQGLPEFRAEIELLLKVRHRNLVSLVGYCTENNEMILVYEYIDNKSLNSHLHGTESPRSLSWDQRLNICIEAAKGIEYLHGQQIIHRDIKSSNILIDHNFNAKVADFGLSKIIPDDCSEIVTGLKGSRGYMDPFYMKTSTLTKSSDVYSFGVVLLEVLTGRRAYNMKETDILKAHIVNWVIDAKKTTPLEQLIDSRLTESIDPISLDTYWKIARRCVNEESELRPSMEDVVFHLRKVKNPGHNLEDIPSTSGTHSDVDEKVTSLKETLSAWQEEDEIVEQSSS